MTDAEKLQALIELAAKHGYPTRGCYVYDWIDDYDNKGFLFKNEKGIVCDPVAEETIMFDHAFIKALCMAKYQELDKPGNFLGVTAIVQTDWQTQIRELAVSDNRISYLYDTFIQKK